MKKNVKFISLILVFIVVFFSTACNRIPLQLKTSSPEFKRILPISPSVEEIILGLAEPENIVAITSYQKETTNPILKEKVGKIKNIISPHPSTEEIMSYNPDCIIMPILFNKEQADTLEEMGFHVVRLDLPEGYDQIKERILHISKELHMEEKGNQLIMDMDKRMKKIKSHLKNIKEKKIVVGYSPLGAFGRKGGAFDHICIGAGVINAGHIVNLKRGDHITKEQIIKINPDVIIYSASSVNATGVDDVKNDPAFSAVKAVKNNQILVLEDRYMSSVTQYFVDSVEIIARNVYPEAFEN